MKKALSFFIIIIMFFVCSPCFAKEKAKLAFSKTPFSKETGYTLSNTFKAGDKIYYAVYNPKGFKTKLLKLQVFKKAANDFEFWGYEYLYNRTLELTNKNTYADFVVINSQGYFVFQIFDYTNFLKPVVMGIIKVE